MTGIQLIEAAKISEVIQDQPGANDMGLELSHYLKLFLGLTRRYRLLIGSVVLGALVLGVVVTLLMAPTYVAMSQLLIASQADQIIEGSDLQKADAGLDTDRFLQTQMGILGSRTLAKKVIQGGGYANTASFFNAFGAKMPVANQMKPGESLDNARMTLAVDLLLKAQKLDMPVNSRIASVAVRTRSPELSAALANSFADRYLEYNLEQRYDRSSYARQFLSQQLEGAREKLTQSERDLNRFARVAGLIRVSSTANGGGQETDLSVTNNTLIDISDQAAKATAERVDAENTWKAISGGGLLDSTVVNSNQAVTSLLTQRASAEADLANELARHRDAIGSVQAKRAAIADLDLRIKTIARSIRNSVKLQYQAAAEKERSLQKLVGTMRNLALTEQDRRVQYSVLKRVADTNRSLYESLLSRYNELTASAGSSTNNVTIVDRAELPVRPYSPSMMLNLILALLAGLIVATGAVFVVEIFDDSIGSPEELERKLGLPLLGLVPLQAEDEMHAMSAVNRSGASEAIQTLVTNLRYSTASGLPKVLAVTSWREAEGKSTLVRGIASSVAHLGNRVLIIDADLRRPTLHRHIPSRPQSGLTDLLTGQATFDQVVVSSESGNISYLAGLPMPPDPAQILSNGRLPKLLEEISDRFDLIVIDCPPLLGLSDAAILSTLADGTLFVIDGSNFHRGAVKSALHRLNLVGANVVGIVLNRFKAKIGADDYNYYTYNYYQYGNEKP